MRITQILVNLLNNAVKFTPAGGHIWLIAASTKDDERAANQLAIRIRDTGAGIPQPAIPLVFACSCRAMCLSSGRARV